MSFKKTWDSSRIISDIYCIMRECSSPYNDGYTSFELKKELYEIKQCVDKALKSTPKFVGEEEWLTEQERSRIIKHLKS